MLYIADLFELILYCVYSTQADMYVCLDESVSQLYHFQLAASDKVIMTGDEVDDCQTRWSAEELV